MGNCTSFGSGACSLSRESGGDFLSLYMRCCAMCILVHDSKRSVRIFSIHKTNYNCIKMEVKSKRKPTIIVFHFLNKNCVIKG